jgi:[acyl-carrier-protein] S-malonyltransferase
MSRRLAILCPGQGAQHAGMFSVLGQPVDHALLRDWQLDEALGQPLERVLADTALQAANRIAQPLLVAATLAAWHVVQSVLPAPALVAGYSIGELSAYAVAGSLDEREAVRIAAARAQAMDRCKADKPPQAMLAVSGLTAATLASLLPAGRAHVAISTGAASFVVAGWADAMPALEERMRSAGAQVTPLPVQVASHTPLMEGAVQPVLAVLHASAFAAPRIPVVAGISGELVTGVDTAQRTLSRQVAERIRWDDCMDACVEAGVDTVLELGPGSALARMFHARHPPIACRSIADFRTVEGLRRSNDRPSRR